MKKGLFTLIFYFIIQACSKGGDDEHEVPPQPSIQDFRAVYSRAPALWPEATWIDKSIKQVELAPLQTGPSRDSLGIEKIALGKALFFDSRIGGTGPVSCANSCHLPMKNYTDHFKTPVLGGDRNSPSLENAWYLNGNLFHDGRAKTYHQQIEEAITSPIEMNQPMATLPAKLAAFGTYQPLFDAAYGDEEINRERILDALAAYTQTIVSGETRFDKFLLGNYNILNDQEIKGLHLFRTKGKCINCHNGPYFTDLQYHNLGYSSHKSSVHLDSGRYVATGRQKDIGRFRTLGLRNVSKTFPYFHNGSLSSLEEVIDAKNEGIPTGQDYIQVGVLSRYIKPLGLTNDEKKAIIAFLNTLNSDILEK